MSGRTSETLSRGFKLSAKSLGMRSRICTLISRLVCKSFADVLGSDFRNSAEDLRTSFQIETQTLGRISRSSVESLNHWPRVSDVRPDISNSDIRHDAIIC